MKDEKKLKNSYKYNSEFQIGTHLINDCKVKDYK